MKPENKENKMRVYLQYPWKFPDSAYYNSLVKYPPKGVTYLNAGQQGGAITSRKKFFLSNSAKNLLRFGVDHFPFPIPNIHCTKTKEQYDLIHCAHSLSSNHGPWVADFESAWQFWISIRKFGVGQKPILKTLLNDNCKKIMPWTNVIKKDILRLFPNKEIEEKIEVVNPAVPLLKKVKKTDKIKIIFISRYFWIKGGLVALETFRKIKEKYDAEIVFISNTPENLKTKYKGIKFMDLMPAKEFLHNLGESDIFFYPSFLDTFGFLPLESMSLGVPIVTVNTGGTTNCREITEDNKTGFVIDFPYYKGNDIYKKCYHIGAPERRLIEQLYNKTSKLIEDSSLRNKMSINCRKVIKNGKFSIKVRNEKLRRIYSEALR
jgi:glycosyltransferase involved in cell wall biosynthesis